MVLFAQSIDAASQTLARLQIDGPRLLTLADTRRCARRDDVAGQKRHKLADIGDEKGHTKDHVAGVSVLADCPIDFAPKPQVIQIGDVVPDTSQGPIGPCVSWLLPLVH